MSDPRISAPPPPAELACEPRRWWREWELLVLTLIVAVTYFSRMCDLTIRGEETRRALVAQEILDTGDWIVPRQQRQVYLSRPPLGSYPIAMLGLLRGQVDLVAVRLPSLLATLATAILLYAYGRRVLSRLGALSAAASFATMGQVLQLGRLAESEAQFTFLVCASLLVWHWGYTSRWPMALTWSLGYLFSALAGLTKGPQGLCYFVGPVFVLLVFRRDWRMLLSRSHAAGSLAFAVTLGAWQAPFYLATDWQAVKAIWLNNATERFADFSWAKFFEHLATYPVELLVCMLPWSPVLLRYASGRFRRELGAAAPFVMFWATCLAVTFPTVWFAIGARGRYFMPLYPCFALLIGLVIERTASSVEASMRKGWAAYTAGLAAMTLGGTAVVCAAGAFQNKYLTLLAQSPTFMLGYAAAGLATAGLLLLNMRGCSPRRVYAAVLATTVFAAFSYSGVVVNALVRSSEDTRQAVAQLKAKLPPGTRLISFGVVETVFSYYFGDPIELHALPNAATWPESEYFCFNCDGDKQVEFPFPWRQEAVVSCDRARSNQPKKTVVVGRRMDTVIANNAENRAARSASRFE